MAHPKFDDVWPKVLEIFPYATCGEDNDGQLIIYTDRVCDEFSTLVPFEHSEED